MTVQGVKTGLSLYQFIIKGIISLYGTLVKIFFYVTINGQN